MNRRTFLARTLATGLAGSQALRAQQDASKPDTPTQLWAMGASELASAIRSRQVSATEVVRAHLDRIEKVNSKLNAVTVTLSEQALRAAAQADEAIAQGKTLGPLWGVPITVKENIDLLGSATTQGVIALKDNLPERDAAHVAKLKRAGVIPIGRTNLPDFGLRWHTHSQLHGATLNPWDSSLTPGGSSGGEAVALATGMTPLGLGNDYGGSLRWPSQCCGTAAIKPTTGRVPFSSPTGSLMTLQLFAVQGPMARHVKDLRLALANMSGSSPADPLWTPAPLEGPPVNKPVQVAVCLKPGGIQLHPDVEAGVRKAARALSQKGYIVEEKEPPHVDQTADLWVRLVTAELALSLPELRPIVSEDAARSLDLMLESRPLPSGEAYMRGWQERSVLAQSWSLFLHEYPIVLGPVCTNPPFKAGIDVIATEQMRKIAESMSLVVTVNLLGLPSAAVPVGLVNGLPQGVQLIGSRFREDLCLDAAEAIEESLGTLTPIDPRV